MDVAGEVRLFVGTVGILRRVERFRASTPHAMHSKAGLNYGWPDVTYGIEYSGRAVGRGLTEKPGTEQPVYYWDPVIAPSGMAFYDAASFPGWRGAMLVGGLRAQALVVLRLADGRVATEERVPLGARIRDVKVGPDGAVYALTEGESGGSRILRVAPAT